MLPIESERSPCSNLPKVRMDRCYSLREGKFIKEFMTPFDILN